MTERRINPKGEMPFLDHLEELRWRILWSLFAVVAGTLRYFRTEREIASRSYSPRYGLIQLVVAVSLLVGLALVVYLIINS